MKKKRKGFHGTRYADMQANSNNETSEQSTSSEIPPGARSEDELPTYIKVKIKLLRKLYHLILILKYIFHGLHGAQTRKRRRASSNIHAGCSQAGEVVPINGYKIIKSSILQVLLDAVSKCPNCGADKSIKLQQNNKIRKGMCERILLTCVVCKSIIKELNTSPKAKTNETGLIDIKQGQ